MLTFKIKFIQHLARQKKHQGFTLLELLTVVVIVGILAAIAVPNLLQQMAKGRQAEAVNNLGAINRTQQAYRYENGVFGTVGDGVNGTVPVKLNNESPFYKYLDKATPSETSASYYADVLPTYDHELKDYSSSVGLTSDGTFSAIICGAINAHPAGGVGISSDGTRCGFNTVPVQ